MHKNLHCNDEKLLSRHRPAAIIPDLDMTMLDAFHLARAHSMHLISDGCRIIIAPYIPPGWREVPIRIKNAANQSNGGMPCAA